MSDRIDMLTTRMVDVIDALPVPAGPGGLRPRTLAARRRVDPVTIIVLVAVLLAVFAGTPAGRAAVTEAGRLIERLFGLGPWPAYYGRLTTDALGVQVEELMFWDGVSSGRSTGIASGAGYRGGWWSSDGAAYVVAVGSLIYVGDRSGVIREVASVDPLTVTQVDWVGPDRIVALARSGDSDRLVHVDLRTRNVTRELLPEDARPARQLGLLGVADPGGVPPQRKFSSDGRWLITGDDLCRSVAVYDLALHRRIELADGVETRGVALGWLRGSVLIWATCDLSARTLHIRAGAPDAAATEVGAIPLDLADQMAAVRLDTAHDRILFPGKIGDDLVVWALGLDGQQTELMRLRSPSGFRALDPLGVSRDGRLLAFSALAADDLIPIRPERGSRGFYAATLARSGVIDLDTGQITWACDADCARIRLR